MEAVTENSIRQEQIESFGRLMAGFSHDMKNHLGIIRESNGLMEDIIAMGGCGEDEVAVERLKKSISAIERRVVIAANMLQHLSRFAHRPDTPFSSFQLNELITEEITLLERFSRLKQIDLTLQPGEGVPAVYNDPSLVQHVFYRLYILCLEQLASGQGLVIITGQDENNAVVTFRLPGTTQVSLDPPGSTLAAAISKLSGVLELVGSTKEHADLKLTVPSLPVQ